MVCYYMHYIWSTNTSLSLCELIYFWTILPKSTAFHFSGPSNRSKWSKLSNNQVHKQCTIKHYKEQEIDCLYQIQKVTHHLIVWKYIYLYMIMLLSGDIGRQYLPSGNICMVPADCWIRCKILHNKNKSRQERNYKAMSRWSLYCIY